MSQSAVVVPALRLRRDTAGWSYRIPAGMSCSPGSLVIVPFRQRPTLGVIWELREDDLAKEQITNVLTTLPLVLAPHRQVIEYLAEEGLCSLSTALFVWLPRWLRTLPLTRAAQSHLQRYSGGKDVKQQALLLPGRRPVQEKLLASKNPAVLFAESGEEAWWNVLEGKSALGFGRDGTLFAPWRNLQKLVVIDPEDISYYHEQTPYLPLLDIAQRLAQAYGIRPEWRSLLPTAAAEMLWGEGALGTDALPQKTGHIDLRHEPPFGDVTLSLIQETVGRGETVLILHNAYDRLSEPDPQGRRKPVPGVQGLSRDLARKLGMTQLPESIAIGTRAILQRPYQNVGLTIALRLDQLLETTLFADQLHGWSDLGHLFRYGGSFLMQSHYPEHPLVQSLLRGTWSDYVAGRINGRKNSALPPFCQQIVVSIKEDPDAAAYLHARLQLLLREPWQLSYPFSGTWRKKEYTHVMLTASINERMPISLRQALVALQSPWKVQRRPWHVL